MMLLKTFLEEAKGWVWSHVRKDLLVVQCPLARLPDTYQTSDHQHNGVEPIW